MNSRKKKIGLVLLAIPFLAMLLMIGINFYNINAHKEYRIEIEGYDPRDLLKGHYLVFRYKWPENMNPDNIRAAYACACLSGETVKPDVKLVSCPDKKARAPEICPVVIKTARQGDDYQPYESARRYYIPEAHAATLETMLRSGKYKFEVGVVPREDGLAQIKMMYIDGKKFDDVIGEPLDELHTIP